MISGGITTMKIVALGDSITQGFPYSTRESWVYYAARELDLDIVNQGICGNLTRDMLARFKEDVVDYRPTHVILLGGTNDAFMGCSVDEVSANITSMIDMADKNGITPILGLPIPTLITFGEIESLLAEYREWIKDYTRCKGIKTIDFYTPFLNRILAGTGMSLYADEAHPSLEGYGLMGKVAVESLRELIR